MSRTNERRAFLWKINEKPLQTSSGAFRCLKVWYFLIHINNNRHLCHPPVFDFHQVVDGLQETERQAQEGKTYEFVSSALGIWIATYFTTFHRFAFFVTASEQPRKESVLPTPAKPLALACVCVTCWLILRTSPWGTGMDILVKKTSCSC